MWFTPITLGVQASLTGSGWMETIDARRPRVWRDLEPDAPVSRFAPLVGFMHHLGSGQLKVLMTFLRYFFYIIGGALASSLLGGLFACAVSLISPDFVKSLFSPPAGTDLVRYGVAIGMIWGIFLGTAVMGFSLFLVTAVQVARLLKKKSEEQSDA